MKTNTGWDSCANFSPSLVFTQGLRRLSPPMDQAPVKFQTSILQFIENVCFLAKNRPFIFFWVVLGLCCYMDFSLVVESTGSHLRSFSYCSRDADFSSCSSWALEHRLSSCGAQAQVLLSM